MHLTEYDLMKISPFTSARPCPLASSIAATIAIWLVGASGYAAVITLNESNSTNLWTLPAGTNLMTGAPVLPNTANTHEGSSGSWATLTDEILGAPADKFASVTPNNGDSVTFSLDVGVNYSGYSLTSFDSYCSWPDSGRDNQNFTIQYATVSAPTTFLTIAVVNNQTGGAINSTHTKLTDTTGILAANVAYLRFNFAGQENGYVGYREFIALGTASVLSTPISWSGAGGSGGNATWVSTPDTNWKRTDNGTPINYDSTSPLTFDSTGTNRNITVQAAGLGALSMTFTNDITKAYTIGGGSITTASLTASGTGSVTLNSSNTILLTTVNDGTLNAGHNNALTALVVNSGTVNFTTAAPVVTSLAGPGGTIVLGNTTGPVNTTLTVGSSNASTTYEGVITNAPGAVGSLTKVGNGTLTLSGTNTYTGNTAINAGAIAYNISGVESFGGAISGAGSVINQGFGEMTLSGLHSYTGRTTVNSGTLIITNGVNTTAGSLVLNGGILNLASFSDYGVASAMGLRQASSDTSIDANTPTAGIGLQFRGGTLQYTGSTPQSTNRNIRVLNGPNTATIDASGSVPSATLSFTHSGANVNLFEVGGTRTITLTGTNTGNNGFAILLENQGGGGTSLAKTGTGTWLLNGPTANTNTNGTTSVTEGILSLAKLNATAVPGPLVIGNGSSQAVLKLDTAGTGSNQIADNIIPTFTGNGATAGILRMNNRNETIGGLASPLGEGVVENEAGAAGTGVLTVNVTGTQTFGGSLRNGDGAGTDGTLALTKSGAGTQILSGASTHTGATTISAGTLTVDGTLGAGTTVSVGSNATLNGSGALSGAVSVNNGGTLSGNGTYTGLVSVANGGTLSGNATLSTVTTVSGSRISPGSGTTPATLTIGALTLAGGSVLNFEFGGTSDFVHVTGVGGLILNGGTFNLFEAGGIIPLTTNGTYNLLGYTTSFGGTLANLTVGNSQVGKVYSIADNGTGLIRLTLGTTTITEWNGTAGDGLWTSNGNWVGGTAPNGFGAVAKFGSIPVVVTTVAVNGPKTVGGILLDNGAGYLITGGPGDTISLNNGVAAASITVTSGSHAIAVPLVLNASSAVATTATGTVLTISGSITGTKSFGADGTGTTILIGTNAYANTSLTGGTLQIGNGGTTGSVGSGDVTASNGTTLVFNRSNDLTVANNIFGTGAQVTKLGAGILTLTGSNSFGTAAGGGLNLNAGTVKLGSVSALGNGVTLSFDGAQLDMNGSNVTAGALVSTLNGGSIVDSGPAGTTTLTVNQATDATFRGNITQTTRVIAVTKTGAGALTLTGNNSFTSPLTILNGAIIAAGTGGNVPVVSNVTLGDGNNPVFLIAGATGSQFGPNTAVTFSNGAKDAKLMLRGSAQTLAGVDGSLSQALSIIQNDEAGTPGYVGGTGLATLTLNTTTNHSFAGLIRNQEGGGLNIVKDGPGTQEIFNVLVATSQYGNITVNAGKLAFNMIPNGVQTNQLGNGSIVVNSPGTLVFDGDWATGGNTPFTRIVSGNGDVLKQGPGTVRYGSANTYTGATTVSSGILIAAVANTFSPGSAVTLANVAGAGLDLNGFNQIIGSLAGGGASGGNVALGSGTLTTGNGAADTSYAGVISGTGGLTKQGGEKFTLTAVNTYQGATSINGGILSFGASSNLGDATQATNTLSFNGGTLQSTGAAVNLGANRSVAVGTSGGTVEVTATNVLTVPGAISGVGNSLAKTGNGTLTLTGTQNYGTFKTSAGTTNVNGSFTGGTSTVNANATTNFGASQTLAALNIGTVTFAPSESGSDAISGLGATSAFGADMVPEPGSLGLLLTAALGLLARRPKRRA